MVIESIKNKDTERAISDRNELCKTLAHEVVPALCSFAEWQSLNRRSKPEDLSDYIQNDIIPELNRIHKWINIINMPLFTDDLALARLVIQQRTLKPLQELTRDLPTHSYNGVKEELRRNITDIAE